MELDKGTTDRLKNVAMTGAALALAGVALKNQKYIGEMLRSAAIWEKSQSICIDLVESGKGLIRLGGVLVSDTGGRVIDVIIDERDWQESDISSLEQAFSGNNDEQLKLPEPPLQQA